MKSSTLDSEKDSEFEGEHNEFVNKDNEVNIYYYLIFNISSKCSILMYLNDILLTS